MPVPDEVDTYRCMGLDFQESMKCVSAWQPCEYCDGEEGPDDKCAMCTGSGGGYICGVHDTQAD